MTQSHDTRRSKQHAAPRLDLHTLIDNLKLPGIDTKALIESRRKDIEALLEANERAFTGMEALTRKQVEMLAEVMKEWQEGTKELISSDTNAEKVNQLTQQAQKAFGHAINHMIDLAEIASQSHSDVRNILEKRYQDALSELRQSVQPKPSKQ